MMGQVTTFAENVSVIGVRYLFDRTKSSVRKAIWIILILFGFGLAAFQIQDRIKHYLKYPTSTDIKVVRENSLRFPKVTICNENDFSKKRLKNLSKYNLLLFL